MDTLMNLGMAVIAILLGIGAIAWQIVERREKIGITIFWVAGIIPIPISIVGVLSLLVGIGLIIALF